MAARIKGQLTSTVQRDYCDSHCTPKDEKNFVIWDHGVQVPAF